jgi:hypothetical protein
MSFRHTGAALGKYFSSTIPIMARVLHTTISGKRAPDSLTILGSMNILRVLGGSVAFNLAQTDAWRLRSELIRCAL